MAVVGHVQMCAGLLPVSVWASGCSNVTVLPVAGCRLYFGAR